MKKTLKVYAYSIVGLAAVVGAVVSPAITSAVADTKNTTINATVASVISMTTTGPVALAITPVTGGAQTSASDTVTVNSNNAAGFTLGLKDADAVLNLVSGANTIIPTTGTFGTPAALANNSWGFGIPGGTGFDGTYSVLSNVTSSATKWAAITASDATIKSTSAVATNDVTTVWYSAKADTTKPNGVYTDIVTYTATTK